MPPSSHRIAFARRYFETLCGVLSSITLEGLARALEVLEQAYAERRHIFLAGNGGSASTASHMANDLGKTVAGSDPTRVGFRVIALTDNVPLLTAWANDVSYEEVFVRPLRGLARAGDVLMVLSGSGNSQNVIRAAQAAKEMGLTTIALLGRGGGALKRLVDIAVDVPSDDYGPIEDAHLAISHLLTAYFREALAAGRISQNVPCS